jgi:hypothetical protein
MIGITTGKPLTPNQLLWLTTRKAVRDTIWAADQSFHGQERTHELLQHLDRIEIHALRAVDAMVAL